MGMLKGLENGVLVAGIIMTGSLIAGPIEAIYGCLTGDERKVYAGLALTVIGGIGDLAASWGRHYIQRRNQTIELIRKDSDRGKQKKKKWEFQDEP